MTAQQLKIVTARAAICKVRLTHERTGYFIHVVTIGKKLYTDADLAIARLETLRLRSRHRL